MKSKEKIGVINNRVIQLLKLNIIPDTPVYIGETNDLHMKNKHNCDYSKYRDHISEILNSPDYVGLNQKDNSIEYVKEFIENGEYVKVAVRVSISNNYYARTLYVLNSRRVKNFIDKGTLIKY